MNGEIIKDRVLCVFFPRRCKYCGRVIAPSDTLCEYCLGGLPEIEKPVCHKCAKSKADCSCKNKSFYYERIAAPFYYTGAVKTAVNRMKFKQKKMLCEGYADDMARCVEEEFGDEHYDTVCFVPFTAKQKRMRSYNQSEELARHLAKKLEIPFCGALVKLYSNRVQHSLNSLLRGGNVFGVFDVSDPSAVRDKTVLLVDDIKTTGATLNECAKMLRIYGAKKVDCICFAVANKQKIDRGD